MNENHKMNVWQLTILTAVNMMGSGIIMLPSNLAEFGGISIVSWLVVGLILSPTAKASTYVGFS